MTTKTDIKEEQEVVSKTWGHVWDVQNGIDQHLIFKNRLFEEGYSAFKKYVPDSLSQIVEIGAGTGRYSLKVAQDFPDIQVIITDITEESLIVVKNLAKQIGVKNIETQIEDVTCLSFEDSSVEAIMMDCVIPHVPDYERAMFEVGRVLKPGGLLVMAHVNPLNIPHSVYRFWVTHFGKGYDYGLERAFSRSTWKRLCEKNGLTVIAKDGFSVGYGLYRHKNRHKIYKLLGRIMNRSAKIIDSYTGGWCSRNFGFETITVAVKNS